ncbi:hypothetical protein LTR56_027786, partial [Elasticomyces elasticus]
MQRGHVIACYRKSSAKAKGYCKSRCCADKKSLAETGYSPTQDAAAGISLRLVRWEELDEGHQYNETPPRYIQYSIEWKLTMRKTNKRVVARETEQN